jgi:hypothetical protein
MLIQRIKQSSEESLNYTINYSWLAEGESLTSVSRTISGQDSEDEDDIPFVCDQVFINPDNDTQVFFRLAGGRVGNLYSIYFTCTTGKKQTVCDAIEVEIIPCDGY